jgi:2-dehydro-3-deoxyphosphooctonate aldolase (KDO 8-P synthase)
MRFPLEIQIDSHQLKQNGPFFLIAGPCVMESEALCMEIGEALTRLRDMLQIPVLFKNSFDKANRTKGDSFRGPGIDHGLEILRKVRETYTLPLLVDVHEPWQAASVAQVAHVLQVPAFLCRQTDLIAACGKTGRVVNLKKGQFLAPDDMTYAAEKALRAGAAGIILTERGSTFGYHDLVCDMRSIAMMQEARWPVVFDGTHSLQKPGGLHGRSGGDRRFLEPLCLAAMGAGADGLFVETHPEPDLALSDAATQVPLSDLPRLIEKVLRVWRAVHEG